MKEKHKTLRTGMVVAALAFAAPPVHAAAAMTYAGVDTTTNDAIISLS